MEMTSSLFLLLIVPLRLVAAAPVVFDHYVLALTWPNAFCKLEQFSLSPCLHPEEKHIPQIFTVHGFWPAFVNGTSVPYSSCTASAAPFKLSNLNNTVLSLANMYWPDVKMTKDRKVRPEMSTGFWKHEWDYHGICSNLQQADYMYLALTVYKLKVQQHFIDLVNNHRKTGNKTVDVIQFQQDLTTLLGGHGYTPILVCGKLVKNNDQYLREIRLRVKKSFPYDLISDSSNSTIKCDTSKTVYFW